MQSLPMLVAKDGEIAALREQLKISCENVAALEIPLSELKEVPRRQRKLTVDPFAEVRGYLRDNALRSAITVRTRRDGGYQVISGRNGAAAFKKMGKDDPCHDRKCE